MNIKSAPCLARIVAPGYPENGWIVQVLHAAPSGVFSLPNGCTTTDDHRLDHWVCESLMHSNFTVKTIMAGIARPRQTRFAVIQDHYLRPLPGIEDPEQIDERMPESEAA